MRELLIPTLLSVPVATALGLAGDREWNERMLDKWGIAFVGLMFTIILAGWLARTERARESRRQVREDQLEAQRKDREDAANAERLAMQTEIRDLNLRQLELQSSHAKRLEGLVKDGNKAQADVAMEMKNLARKIRCPGQSS